MNKPNPNNNDYVNIASYLTRTAKTQPHKRAVVCPAGRDKKGRIWFCGRKSHRAITENETLFSIPCEAIFNQHASVRRSALVGIGPSGRKIPVMCIETETTDKPIQKKQLIQALKDLAKDHVHTRDIDTFLFHKSFPVDIRHNSKIFREKLTDWAQKRLGDREK